MRKARTVIAVLIVAVGASMSADAATTGQTRADKNACVVTRTIHDFKALDRNKLVIWAPSRRNAYLIELSMPLPELKFAHRLAIVDRNHDGRLCGFGMDRIIVADSSLRTPSTILGMTRLDDESLAQLEAQYDVRLTRKKAAPQDAPVTQEQSESN
jgi:hypothetical protein